MNVLVIDDDDMVSDSLDRALTHMGHTVMVSRHGVIPVGFVPEVVICDWDLGMYDDRDGGQIVTDLRDEAPTARYIICSGLDRDVPEGVEFFSKGDSIEMLKSLSCDC